MGGGGGGGRERGRGERGAAGEGSRVKEYRPSFLRIEKFEICNKCSP